MPFSWLLEAWELGKQVDAGLGDGSTSRRSTTSISSRDWEESDSSDFGANRSELDAMDEVISFQRKRESESRNVPGLKPSACGKNDIICKTVNGRTELSLKRFIHHW